MAVDAAAAELMVVRGCGPDAPGIASDLIQTVADHGYEVFDLAHYSLDGSLMFSFMLRVGERVSADVREALQKQAERWKLKLEFGFPGKVGEQSRESANVAVLSVVSAKDITPELLCGLDAVLSEHKCTIKEIQHHCDNKKQNNGEYNKVEIRIFCPPGVKLSTLQVGAPTPSGGSSSGLQKVAWEHGAEMTIRWWDAVNRPSGKSLVVFGLSQELFTTRPLDEVVREAGGDPRAVPQEDSLDRQHRAKVAMLKGKSEKVIQKTIERLEFTPGARLVCHALKRLGCRLVILTNVGVKAIAEHAKHELGIDYVISRDVETKDGVLTGNYIGELSDVRFRKTDLLMLMAERENVDHRNVILIGEEVTHLNPVKAREVIEMFGPNIFFNSGKLKDLTIALYLLGFNGSDMRSLRRTRPFSEVEHSAEQSAPSAKRFKVQLVAEKREPGQLKRILDSVAKQDLRLATVMQCSLEGGGICAGFDFQTNWQEPEAVLSRLLPTAEREGFRVMGAGSELAQGAAECSIRAPCSHVITVVQKPCISAKSLSAVLKVLSNNDVNIWRVDRLSVRQLAALQYSVCLPKGLDAQKISAELVAASKELEADIAIQKDDMDRWTRRLVVFDMDSTLIQQEVIDELAKIAGVEHEVKTITEAAMRGEIDFFQSLKQRVALLKGHNAEKLFAAVKANLIFTPGARKLCKTLQKLGYKMAVISGGFLPVAREVQRYLGLDYAFANSLEVDETTGLLTGNTSGPVVTPQRKRALLAMIADVEGCELRQTIAVGDGANDIPMLHAAGLGIAFCAKPKVQEASQFRINQKDLSTVLFLIGVSEHGADRLAGEESS